METTVNLIKPELPRGTYAREIPVSAPVRARVNLFGTVRTVLNPVENPVDIPSGARKQRRNRGKKEANAQFTARESFSHTSSHGVPQVPEVSWGIRNPGKTPA